ncbi:MAG: hypothetical protein HC927_03390, partial [Deltaproteobacteria bacterium]|nr:hypothetical protein [Deltaproteobacteria bacterium]
MSSTFPTLPTGPFEHVALDYARLRAEGIRLLGRLAGQQWTDFNTSDPGVTILEQLCYAITDLAYRTNYPIRDLLAGSAQAMPEPAAILSCNPVTLTDLRKLALDDALIENAWIDDELEPELVFHYQEAGSKLDFGAGDGEFDAGPVELHGLHRVLLQPTTQTTSTQAEQSVIARLHQHRGLGEDFEFAQLGEFPVWVDAEVEVGPVVDLSAVEAAILAQLGAYLNPVVRFVSASEAEARGQRLEQIFEGPLLARGVVAALPERRSAIYSSDLIHAIMDVPEVRAVRSLKLRGESIWMLEVPAGKFAKLSTADSNIRLHVGTTPTHAAQTEAPPQIGSIPVEAPISGRERELGLYASIQDQLPATYGIGALGLPASASAQRKAQARQLEAYLLIFDQLLANAFAQLAHAHELLVPAAEDAPTYFTQAVAEPYLQDLLAGPTDVDEPTTERRRRFLAHLLARFGEHLGDHRLPGNVALSSVRKRDYLQQFPQLSAGRGSGANVLAWIANQPLDEGVSTFERRIRLLLGLPADTRFHVIEHVLLRPIGEDAGQLEPDSETQVPLLETEGIADPWSLQISVAFERPDDEDFAELIEHTLLSETPAHLTVHLHWFEDANSWLEFEAAWADYRVRYGEYRREPLTPAVVPIDPAAHHLERLRLRDARDRLLESLSIGLTYPLRDIPLPTHAFVESGEQATILLPFSQIGVTYYLVDADDLGAVLTAGEPGTGDVLALATPEIFADLSCRVLAVKTGSNPPREAHLHGTIAVQEGVDPKVGVTYAQFVEYGATVQVSIHPAQKNVEYKLYFDDPNTPVSDVQSGPEGSTVVLTMLAPVYEDIDLHVRGQLIVGTPHEGDLLASVAVRVAPNFGQTVTLDAGVVAFGGGTMLVLPNTQASVRYRVWGRTIAASEFVFTVDEPAFAVIPVQGEGEAL